MSSDTQIKPKGKHLNNKSAINSNENDTSINIFNNPSLSSKQ